MSKALSKYKQNRKRAVFVAKQPSLTDQSQARDTDINVIIKRYGVTGTAPGAASAPMYEDFSELPQDLRGMIEQSRSVAHLRRTLPEKLRDMPVEELLGLTPDALTNILKPPAPTPEPEKEQK